MKTVQVNIRVPYEVRHEWKTLALNEEKTLTDMLVEAMRTWKESKANPSPANLSAIAESRI